MKAELQAEMFHIAAQSNASLPKYNRQVIIPTKNPLPSSGVWYEMGDNEYLEHFTEERTYERYVSVIEDENEFLYKRTSLLVKRLAQAWELEYRKPGVDSRRLLFSKEIELFGIISPEWQKRALNEITAIVSRNPYRDKRIAKLRLESSYNWIDTESVCPSCGNSTAIRSQMNLASSFYGDETGVFNARQYSVGDKMSWFNEENKYYKALWQSDGPVGTGTEACHAECMSCGAHLSCTVTLKEFVIQTFSDISTAKN